MDKLQKKSPLIFYLLGGLIILSGVYSALQYVAFSKRYEQNFLETTYSFEERFKNTLKNYNLVLSEFAKEIKRKDLFLHPDKLSELFKKGYTYGLEDTKGEKLHLSAVNWVDKSESPTIGRFGTLLYSLKLSAEYLGRLRRNPGKLEISNNLLEGENSEFPLVNLGIGVDDDKEVYRGFVNVRVPTQALFESIISSKKESPVHVILLDNNAQVIDSSLGLTADEKRAIGDNIKKRNGKLFSKVSIVFTKMSPIDKAPYLLMFGYSTKILYLEFFDYIWPQLMCLFFFFFIIICFSYFYHLRKLKQGWRVFRKKIVSLQNALHKMQGQYVQVSDKRKTLEEELKFKAEAAREEQKLRLKVNKRISEATSDLLNVGQALLEKMNIEEKLEDTPQKVMDIFEKAYFHACFTCIKNTEETVDVVGALDKSLKIYSSWIMENQIEIRRKAPKTLKPLLTDSVSFQQALVNILGRAIKNIPTEGEMEICLSEKKDGLYIDFKDNGYAAEDLSKGKTGPKEDTTSLDFLSLEWDNLQKLIRSLGGKLSHRYTPYQGNHFAFQLPYQFHKAYNSKETIASSRANNIIPFSSLKRNEKS